MKQELIESIIETVSKSKASDWYFELAAGTFHYKPWMQYTIKVESVGLTPEEPILGFLCCGEEIIEEEDVYFNEFTKFSVDVEIVGLNGNHIHFKELPML